MESILVCRFDQNWGTAMKVTAIRAWRTRFRAMKEGAAHRVLPIEVMTDAGIAGAGEIGLGEEITALMPDVQGAFVIFGKNNVAVLYGNDSTDFSLSVLNSAAGCVEWTAQMIALHGDRIAVGLDVRGYTLAARGWTQEGGDLFETIERLEVAGCARYVVTDVTKDGTLKGPNLELLREVCAVTKRPVVASGGISSLADIAALSELSAIGVEGAIVGKALYAGAFTLQQALEVTRK
jgi:hypothetical protein